MSLFEHADKIEAGVFSAIAHGERTGDLGGKHGTRAFTEAIIKRLGQKSA
jgi:isocitrate dehydrogenase (NAD+)